MKNAISFSLNFLIFFVAVSCNFNANVSVKNSEDDKKDATEVTDLFYAYLQNQEFEKTYSFFSPLFYEVTPKAELKNIYLSSNERLGLIQKTELTNWETESKKGTNMGTEYLLEYNVTRAKFSSTETIRLIKQRDEVKIVAYNVQSPGFDQPSKKTQKPDHAL